MRVLTNDLGKELAKLLEERQVSKVDIATAWATEGSALSALESTKRKLAVRTLAGFSMNQTTPSALKRLAKLGTVRLVEGSTGLFHVKLYLFRGSRGPIAWVGSANFTGPGFGGNEEFLYETDDTDELQAWFNDRWKKAGSQPDRLAAYCREWVKPDVPMPGESPEFAKGAEVIIIEQEGPRPPNLVRGGNGNREASKGVVTIRGERYPYRSAQKCLKVVLDVLQKTDESFLTRCRTDPRFHGKTTHYIGKTRRDLGTEHYRLYPTELDSGWLLSSQTQTQEKWALILAAAEIAGMSVQPGEMWQAEENAKTEVGF